MRHPLLRILIALLIGVITPLCCCQATAMVGTECHGRHAEAVQVQFVEVDSCCGGCPDDASSNQRQDSPADDQQPSPDQSPGCPSCPSCNGTPAGTSINVEARLPAFEQEWHVIATLAIAVLWDLPPLHTLVAALPPGWASDPPFLKANREALRWHCALVV